MATWRDMLVWVEAAAAEAAAAGILVLRPQTSCPASGRSPPPFCRCCCCCGSMTRGSGDQGPWTPDMSLCADSDYDFYGKTTWPRKERDRMHISSVKYCYYGDSLLSATVNDGLSNGN